MKMRSPLLCAALVLLSVPAYAESINDRIDALGQYWQRVNSSSTIFLRGPKAQQILNRDIARFDNEPAFKTTRAERGGVERVLLMGNSNDGNGHLSR